MPRIKTNLCSVGHLMKKGYDIGWYANTCVMSRMDQVVMSRMDQVVAKIVMSLNNMFPLKFQVQDVSYFVTINEKNSTLWHARFEHLNFLDVWRFYHPNEW